MHDIDMNKKETTIEPLKLLNTVNMLTRMTKENLIIQKPEVQIQILYIQIQNRDV